MPTHPAAAAAAADVDRRYTSCRVVATRLPGTYATVFNVSIIVTIVATL